MKLRMTSIFGSFCLLLSILLVTTGCKSVQTYPGTRLSSDQVAKLRCATYYYFVSVRTCLVQQIDGQTTPDRGTGIDLLPGKHEVIVLLVNMPATQNQRWTYSRPQTFSFIAVAGHKYTVDGSWFSKEQPIWIVDEQTKEIVAGTKP